MRFFFYFADALNLRRTVHRLERSDADVVIFDRYIYDELANLPLNSWLARFFIRIVLRLAPKPDVAYVIDADPVAELETVNDGPRRTRHADFDTLDVVHVDAGRECGAREPDRPNRREVHSRYPGATIHREPDLAWILGSEAVKPKRGEQAEKGFGDALGDLGQRVMLGRLERG